MLPAHRRDTGNYMTDSIYNSALRGVSEWRILPAVLTLAGGPARPPKLARPASPDQQRQAALYDRIRALYQNGMKEAVIVAHLTTPEGKDLREQVHAELKRRPKKGKHGKPRTARDVIRAALAVIFKQTKPAEGTITLPRPTTTPK